MEEHYPQRSYSQRSLVAEIANRMRRFIFVNRSRALSLERMKCLHWMMVGAMMGFLSARLVLMCERLFCVWLTRQLAGRN